MARSFVRANAADALFAPSTSAPAQGAAFTVFAVATVASFGATSVLIGRDQNLDAVNARVYQLNVQTGTNQFRIVAFAPGAFGVNATVLPTLGVASRVAATYDGTTLAIYHDSTTPQTTAAAGVLNLNPVGLTIGARSQNDTASSVAQYFDGSLAECAEWTRVLTADEIGALMAGYSPAHMPRDLNWYVPAVGRFSPEVDLVGGMSLTLLGSPGTDAHPRVIYLRRRYLGTGAAAPPAPVPPVEQEFVRNPPALPFRAPVYTSLYEKPGPAELEFESRGSAMAYGGEASFGWSSRALAYESETRELVCESRSALQVRGLGLLVTESRVATSRVSRVVSGRAGWSVERRHPTASLRLAFGGAARSARVDIQHVRADTVATVAAICELLRGSLE